jgi:hypothetical protein
MSLYVISDKSFVKIDLFFFLSKKSPIIGSMKKIFPELCKIGNTFSKYILRKYFRKQRSEVNEICIQ